MASALPRTLSMPGEQRDFQSSMSSPKVRRTASVLPNWRMPTSLRRARRRSGPHLGPAILTAWAPHCLAIGRSPSRGACLRRKQRVTLLRRQSAAAAFCIIDAGPPVSGQAAARANRESYRRRRPGARGSDQHRGAADSRRTYRNGEAASPHMTTLKFEIMHPVAPRDIGLTRDRRRLGIGLEQLGFEN